MREENESRSFSFLRLSTSDSSSWTRAESEAFFFSFRFSLAQASTSICTVSSPAGSSLATAASSSPSTVWDSERSPRLSLDSSSTARKVSGGICFWTAVRNAPQAAASCMTFEESCFRSRELLPDLRVRASAWMPRGKRISSRPGMFLQSSASARRVSSRERRFFTSSSGRFSGGLWPESFEGSS